MKSLPIAFLTILFIILFSSFLNEFSCQYIETVGGTGVAGYLDNVSALDAQLDHPRSVAVDAMGNIYIADTDNHRIRRIDVNTGFMNNVAGNGMAGFSDGVLATDAMLNYPTDVDVDASGNIYIADSQNHRIRKVSSVTGEISTIAGTGEPAWNAETLAVNASLNGPQAIALDASGNIYIADDLNSLVRKIDVSSGVITTVAGGGSDIWSDGIAATDAMVLNPKGVAIDIDGNIYFSQVTHDRIRKVTVETGEINTIAGTFTEGFSGDGGLAVLAEVSEPLGLAVDADFNVYFADKNPLRIRRIIAFDSTIETIAGTGVPVPFSDGGLAIETNLNNATDVAIDPNGCVIIAEYGDSRIRKIECCSQYGCTDPLAINYDPLAECSDVSCLYYLNGCTYPLAFNYDVNATFDDGTCIFLGCTDPSAENFNPLANSDDGSCSFEPCDNINVCPADLNGDNIISVSDLLIFISLYGTICP